MASGTQFAKLAGKYLDIIEADLRPGTMKKYRTIYRILDKRFGEVSVKKINYSLLEDTKHEMSGYAPKTVHDCFVFLKKFLSWCVDREVIGNVPKFPNTCRKTQRRGILNKDDQHRVIEQSKRLFSSVPRASIGLEILATYPKIRPSELRSVTEKDVTGPVLVLRRTKNAEGEVSVRLTESHSLLLEELKTGDPDRHIMSFENGKQFGRDYLFRVWDRSAKSLGIKGVPLYPGTKHTTVTHLLKKYPTSMVASAAGITVQVIEAHYKNIGDDDVVHLYEEAMPR